MIKSIKSETNFRYIVDIRRMAWYTKPEIDFMFWRNTMTENDNKKSMCSYKFYLLFIIFACGGACIWQLFIPQIGEQYSIWGSAVGWQREIALWNIALITAIMLSIKKKDIAALRLLTIQTTTLCWLLGANHLVAFVNSNFSFGSIHFLGFLEVMLCGGIWGTILIFKYRPQK